MNIILRLVLIFSSIFSMCVVIRISQKSKMEVKDAINWIFVTIFFLFMAIFPKAVTLLAKTVGIVDETNAVFMLVIGLLIAIVFYLNIRISRLSIQLRNLVQEIGITEEKNQ